jgi:FkbM family methyltransferase
MSRTVAKIINGFIGAATLPMSERQKEKIFANVGENISRGAFRLVETPRGNLKFYTTRGHSASTEVRSFPNGESETVEWVDTFVKPGDVLWDIGANIGLYSLYASLDKTVNVYAFEPSALNFALLVEHIQANNAGSNVHPLCIALGPETKIGHLQMRNFSTGHWGNALDNAQNQFETFEPFFSQAIPAFRADDLRRVFNLPAPDHIKLDVDGIEELIIAGAIETLPKVKTLIVEIEGHNVENFKTAIEIPLAKAGLIEDLSWRGKGSKRNRVFINKAMA